MENKTSRYQIQSRAIAFVGKRTDFVRFLKELGAYNATQLEFCRVATQQPLALTNLKR